MCINMPLNISVTDTSDNRNVEKNRHAWRTCGSAVDVVPKAV